MSVQTVINVTCNGDNCKHVRAADANNWLVGVVVNGVIYIAPNRDMLPAIWRNNSLRILGGDIDDFCGQECLVKWISRKLMEIKNEAYLASTKGEVGTTETKFEAKEE